MHNFRELKIWQRSKELVKHVYAATKEFPNEERYTLAREIRRSAISVPSNIAEECGRDSDKELARFLDIATGSAYELETQLEIAIDQDFISKELVEGSIVQIQNG